MVIEIIQLVDLIVLAQLHTQRPAVHCVTVHPWHKLVQSEGTLHCLCCCFIENSLALASLGKPAIIWLISINIYIYIYKRLKQEDNRDKGCCFPRSNLHRKEFNLKINKEILHVGNYMMQWVEGQRRRQTWRKLFPSGCLFSSRMGLEMSNGSWLGLESALSFFTLCCVLLLKLHALFIVEGMGYFPVFLP